MKSITADELKKKLIKEKILLVDVRSLPEHRSECIDGDYSIPLAEISIQKIPPKSKKIVLYCLVGKRSEKACQMLLEEDPNLDASFLEGGITAWKKAGGEVKNLGPKILSIDRQIYLSIGILLLLIFILGSCLHTAFHILSGAMGICLMIAGSTGWCGLEKLLVKMPWNR